MRQVMMAPSKELAKRIILEILRQSGGSLGKTRLFKTFWLAHLFYAKKARGYLSDWPIVRMPQGPGIHHGDRLLDELCQEGTLERSHEPRGPFVEISCRLKDDQVETHLSQEAVKAIQEAVSFARQYATAGSLSELSHDFSRSWNNLPDGAELNIYTDLIPDDEYQNGKDEMEQMKRDYEQIFA
jgi:hypothetical protein